MKGLSLRQRQAIVTHNKIYNSALYLFAKKGYGNVTVEDICAKACVSKGAFYLHFKSKNAIPVEQLAKTDEYLKNNLVKKIQSKDSSEDKILSFFINTLEYIDRGGFANKKVMYQIQLARDQSSKIITESSAIYSFLTSVLTSAREKGEIRFDIPISDITLAFTRLMQGLVFEWCLANGSFNLVEEGKKMFPIIWNGIRPR